MLCDCLGCAVGALLCHFDFWPSVLQGDLVLQCDHVIETVTKLAIMADKIHNVNISQDRCVCVCVCVCVPVCTLGCLNALEGQGHNPTGAHSLLHCQCGMYLIC